MSRIGYKPISVPQGVTIHFDEKKIEITGPKGTESAPLFLGINVLLNENILKIDRDENLLPKGSNQKAKKQLKALHGLVRSLVNNCIIGTTSGFVRTLEIKGVGYRAQQKGRDVQLQLGFSHEVFFKVPEKVDVIVKTPTEIIISGTNKELVGQVASDIRGLKKPEPYKGKGIRYKEEHVIMKAGKVGKK